MYCATLGSGDTEGEEKDKKDDIPTKTKGLSFEGFMSLMKGE